MQANDVQWNAQYDVVVVGFGGAGATAARFAADAGAYVLLVDTAPWEEKAAIRAMPHSTLQWAKESAS